MPLIWSYPEFSTRKNKPCGPDPGTMGQGGPNGRSCVGLCSQVVKEIIQVDIATGCRGLTGCKEPDSKQQQGVKQFFHQDIVNYGSLIRRDAPCRSRKARGLHPEIASVTRRNPSGCFSMTRSKLFSKARMCRNAMRFHPEGIEGVRSKLLNPVGRIPNNPSVITRQKSPLSAAKWR